MFSDKLDFIINLTNTQNNKIAQASSIDASHVSRLRSGSRRLPKNPKFLKPMAEYFIKHITTEEQKKHFADTLKLDGGYPKSSKEAVKLLVNWFSDDRASANNYIESFLKDFGKKHESSINISETYAINSFIPTYSNYYFGIQGKKNAMMRLLREIIFHPGPATLYIFSDEVISWISDDDMYASAWTYSLAAIAQTGKTIVVIHSMRKDLNSMFKSIARWVPIYLTGNLKPYYCPKARDGLLHRTLLVSPEVGAVISSSVGDKYDDMLNIYIRDKQALSALHLEFTNLLALCKPVMKAYTEKDTGLFTKKLGEFDMLCADSIMNPRYLSLATLPESVQRSVCARSKQSALFSFLQTRSLAFEENVSSHSVTEIINLPNPELVKSGNVKIAMLDLLGAGYICYTTDELISHLKHIIFLLRKHENYHAIINDGHISGEYIMHIKKNSELLFIKTNAPTAALIINEMKIIQTFWEFMTGQIERTGKATDKEAVIFEIESYIKLLK